MQLKLDGLDAHLRQTKAKGLAPLYVVHGDEHLLVLEAVDRLRQTAREAGFSERDVLVAERNFHWGQLVEAQQSMSLFGDRKIVELRIPSGKPGKDGGEALRAVAAHPSPDVVMLVTLPRLDFATSKSAWFQALESAGVSIKVDSVDRTRLPAWVASAWRCNSSASKAANPAGARCSSSPTRSKATCWRLTRKSRSSACCIRRAN